MIKCLSFLLFCVLSSFSVYANQADQSEKTISPWNKKLIVNIPGLLKTKSYDIKKASYLKYIRSFKHPEFGGHLNFPLVVEYALPDNSRLCVVAKKGMVPTLVTIDVSYSKFEYKTHFDVLTAAGLFKAGYKVISEFYFKHEDRPGVRLEKQEGKIKDIVYVLLPGESSSVYAFFSYDEYVKYLRSYISPESF